MFLAAAAWALFAFTGCNAKQCHLEGWEMPNGVRCEGKVIVPDNQQVYHKCADGREYLNPPSVRHVEVCE